MQSLAVSGLDDGVYIDLSGKFEIQQRFILEQSDVESLQMIKDNINNPDYSHISRTKKIHYKNQRLILIMKANKNLSYNKVCIKKPTLEDFIDSIINLGNEELIDYFFLNYNLSNIINNE